jgi:hypothetical protein
MARVLRVTGAALLILIGLIAVLLSVSLPYALNKEYGVPNNPDPSAYEAADLVSPAVGGLVAGVIAAACILGALHLLGAGRSILPTGLIIIGLVVVASVAGAWIGYQSHEPSLGGEAGNPVGIYHAVRLD